MKALRIGQIVSFEYGTGTYKIVSKHDDLFRGMTYDLVGQQGQDEVIGTRDKTVFPTSSKWFKSFSEVK